MVRMRYADEPGNVRYIHVGFSNLELVKNPGMLQACLKHGVADWEPKAAYLMDRGSGTQKGMGRSVAGPVERQ